MYTHHIRAQIESLDCCVLTYFLFFISTFRFRRVTRGIQIALHLRIFVVFLECVIHKLNVCIYFVIFYLEQVKHI